MSATRGSSRITPSRRSGAGFPTWLDRSRRDVLTVHPRGDAARPATGVFATRAPERPNPVGLHRVTILAIDDLRVRVSDLEALDGTPIVDVKPVIGPVSER